MIDNDNENPNVSMAMHFFDRTKNCPSAAVVTWNTSLAGSNGP